MSHNLEEISARLLDAAKKAGAEAADAVAVTGESLSIDVRAGDLEQAERSEGIDIGLRVLIGKKQACVAASSATDETISALAERAVAMARLAPDDPYCGLADPAQLASDTDSDKLALDDPDSQPDPESLQAMALEAEAAALAVDGITQVEGAGASWGRSHVHLALSNGFSAGYARSSHSIGLSAIAGEGLGMERDHAAESRRRAEELPDAAGIGRLAGKRAVERLNPQKAPTGAYPVLYDTRVASSLIGHMLAASNGVSVARGSSWLKDRMGERILPAGLDVLMEPLRKGAAASRLYDGEGIQCADRAIVKDGLLTGWVLDLATGRQLGMETTADASRPLSGPPQPGSGNIRLAGVQKTLSELLAEMGTGLWVTSMIGSTINPTTGSYSRGAAGFWVENGEIAYPVNELTIAGSLPAMLPTIQAADDADPFKAHIVPSLLVEGLTIASS